MLSSTAKPAPRAITRKLQAMGFRRLPALRLPLAETTAAEELSLTQPAVSHHIRQLEEETDCRIFHRKKGELLLTEEGKIVVKYARRMAALHEKMGRVSDPSINAVMLDTDYLVCVASDNSPLAKQSMVTLSDLRRERMILRLPDSSTRNLFVSNLESVGLDIGDFNVVLEVDNIATIKDLIRKDMGVSILARSACMDELRKGKLTALPIENLSMVRETNLLYHRDFEHTDILRALTKLYGEMARLYQ